MANSYAVKQTDSIDKNKFYEKILDKMIKRSKNDIKIDIGEVKI